MQAGDELFLPLEYSEDKIETKLNNLKKSFLNTIKEQENKTKILIRENNKSYVDIASVNVAPLCNTLHFLLAQKEDLDEAKIRSHNIIIHRVIEETPERSEDSRVKKLLNDTHIKAFVKQCARLG